MMKIAVIVVLIISLFIPTTLWGDATDYYLDFNYITNSINDTRDVFLTPLNWDTHDLFTLGICTGTGLALYLTDKQSHNFVQDHRSQTLDTFTDAANYLGDGWFVIPSQFLLYGYGCLSDDKKARKIALETIESFSVVGITVTGIKMLTGRHRPYDTDDPDVWDGPSISRDHTSFPSGHSSVAFTLATVLAENFRDQPAVGIITYTLAAGTSFARVYKNKHWVSDVFVGAVIGHLITKKIVALHNASETNIVIAPSLRGFSISLSF